MIEIMFSESKTMIESCSNLRPDTLVILGSGLGDFTHLMRDSVVISYDAIPHFAHKSLAGHSGELFVGYLGQKPIYVMKGRNHYYQGITDEEMRYPIQLFRSMGVKNLIVTNACGGINPTFQAGDIMVIEDHINLMGRNPLVGNNVDFLGPRFVDMSEPYDLQWINLVESIAKDFEIHLRKGVYVGYLGPSYETKSEIKAFRMLGGDAVGMSTVPEVITAIHSGMKVLGLSCITNMATGISKHKLTHEEVLEASSQAIDKISLLLLKFIAQI